MTKVSTTIILNNIKEKKKKIEPPLTTTEDDDNKVMGITDTFFFGVLYNRMPPSYDLNEG